MHIDGREIGYGQPPYIVAEVSCNHGGKLARALQLIEAAKWAGADAVKFQAYEADTITIDMDYTLEDGPWAGRRLYDLYRETQTPFLWFPEIARRAKEIGITWFASVFDKSSVDLLESLDCPAYKIASMEIVDLPLIKYAASKGKPMIISTGMADDEEVDRATIACQQVSPLDAALLHCVSGYPTPTSQSSLSSIRRLADNWGVVGISDHTVGIEVPIAATALRACMIEKHFIFTHADPSHDYLFSLDPTEFKAMAAAVRATWRATWPSDSKCEESSRQLRRSLYVVRDMWEGECFTEANVRSIRPAHGLPPQMLDEVIGKHAKCAIKRGTPLSQELIVQDESAAAARA